MNLVYVLVPFFKTDSKANISFQAKQQLGLDNQSPQENIVVHELTSNQFFIQIPNLDFHFLEMNKIIEESDQMKQKISLLESVLKQYQCEPCSQVIDPSSGQNIYAMMKKVNKYKQIKEENKKLKNLLQIQLENTQKVRQQTQKTMKVLREQFDALVIEISNKSGKKSTHSEFDNNANEKIDQAKRQSQSKERTLHSHSNGGKHIAIR